MHNFPHTEEARKKISQALKGIPKITDIAYKDEGCELWDKCLLCPQEPDCIDMDNRLRERSRLIIRVIASSLRAGNIEDIIQKYLYALDCVKEWRIAVDRKQ